MRLVKYIIILVLCAGSPTYAENTFSPWEWDKRDLLSDYIPNAQFYGHRIKEVPGGQILIVQNLSISLDSQHQLGSTRFPYSAYIVKDESIQLLPLTSVMLDNIKLLSTDNKGTHVRSFEDAFKYVYGVYSHTSLPDIAAAKSLFKSSENQHIEGEKWAALGHLYLESGNKDKAIACFKIMARKAYKYWPPDHPSYRTVSKEIAAGYLRMGQIEKATSYIDSVVKERNRSNLFYWTVFTLWGSAPVIYLLFFAYWPSSFGQKVSIYLILCVASVFLINFWLSYDRPIMNTTKYYFSNLADNYLLIGKFFSGISYVLARSPIMSFVLGLLELNVTLLPILIFRFRKTSLSRVQYGVYCFSGFLAVCSVKCGLWFMLVLRYGS